MPIKTILFLCPGNFVRSILAEAIMNKLGAERFQAYSAGAKPHRSIHRDVRNLLKERGYSTDGLHSKSIDLFLRPDAPLLDYAISLCDATKEASCPVFPGQSPRAHWALSDPCQGSLKTATRETVENAFRDISMLIGLFLQAPQRVHDLLHLNRASRHNTQTPHAA